MRIIFYHCLVRFLTVIYCKFIILSIKDNGFGIKTIIGFILQVYFILYHKLSPIIFIDEGFSNLSLQYIPYLRSLLTSLKEEYGFIFVLVSHDPRLIDIADQTYEVKNGEVRLVSQP